MYSCLLLCVLIRDFGTDSWRAARFFDRDLKRHFKRTFSFSLVLVLQSNFHSLCVKVGFIHLIKILESFRVFNPCFSAAGWCTNVISLITAKVSSTPVKLCYIKYILITSESPYFQCVRHFQFWSSNTATLPIWQFSDGTWNNSCMMLFPAAALPRLLLKARGMENLWHSGKRDDEEEKIIITIRI